MRNEYRWSLCLIVAALTLAGQVWAADTVDVSVVTDRPDAMYQCGEQAKFLVSVKKDNAAVTSGEFTYTLTLDGARKITDGKQQLGASPAGIVGTLDTPGILRCTVVVPGEEKPVVKLAAAAFAPSGIEPTAVEPEDFVRFWNHNKQKLAAPPMDVRLTKSMAASTKGMTVYKISLGNILGTRVYGWLGVPTSGGRHPAVLTVPGAGVYPIGPDWVNWAQRGFLAMGISVHDYDVDMPKEKYTELAQGPLAGYPYQNRTSRRSYYFLRSYLGCLRAIDYLTSRPDWDRKSMIVTGSSQGGGLSIVCAGLDPRVTAIASNVPALCDHTGKFHGRPSGWPQLIPNEDPVVTEVAGYFDAVNFARYVKCPTLMGVGLIDTTCPATSVYSAFNVIPAEKQMVASPLMGHSQSPEYSALRERFILEQGCGTMPQPTMRLRGS